MKNIFLLTVSVASLLLLGGCEKDRIASGKIDIEFQVPSMEIDLNRSNNPSVTCVVTSEAGLSSVSMYVLREGGIREAFKEPITNFFNDTYCSIYEKPSYQEDMIGFAVVARDRGGKTAEGTMEFVVTPVVGAPLIVFGTDELAFAEGDPIPDFTFTVAAESPLETVSVELIQSGEPLSLIDEGVIDYFSDPLNLSFDSRDYTVIAYDLNKTPTAVRVVATDTYGKIKISLLPIRYTALPAPALTISTVGPLAADEYSTGNTVEGSVTSNSGIVEIRVLLIGEDYEVEAAKETLSTPQTSHVFSYTFGGDDLRDYVTAVAVIAKDTREKITRQELALAVAPVYTVVGSADDLRAIIDAQIADVKYRNIKLMLEQNAGEYSLGTMPLVPTKNLAIRGQSSSGVPKITGAANPMISFNGIDIDSLVFRHVELSASVANFINHSGNSCSIGRVVLEDCILSKFTTSLLRSQGMNAQEIIVNNCVLNWGNTGSSSGLFHITQSADRIARLTFTNSTVYKVSYFWYNNMTSTAINATLSNCTFLNTVGATGNYFINFPNGSLTGTLRISGLLFGGSNNVSDGYRMLRNGSSGVVATTVDNYGTSDWKTFSDDTTNGSVNFVTTLAVGNAALFTDPASSDWTIKDQTSVVYTSRLGDPRWLPAE